MSSSCCFSCYCWSSPSQTLPEVSSNEHSLSEALKASAFIPFNSHLPAPARSRRVAPLPLPPAQQVIQQQPPVTQAPQPTLAQIFSSFPALPPPRVPLEKTSIARAIQLNPTENLSPSLGGETVLALLQSQNNPAK